MKPKFDSREELEKFKDTSMWCVCNRLMTGLHMMGCSKLKKMEARFAQ